MIAWVASRLAGTVVRIAGGSPEAIDAARVGVAAIGGVIDPLGGLVAIGHAGVSAEARNGNPTAKLANRALMIGSIVSGGFDVPDAVDGTDVITS